MRKMVTTFLDWLTPLRKAHEADIDRSQVEMTVVNHDQEGAAVSETVFLRDGSRFTIPLRRVTF